MWKEHEIVLVPTDKRNNCLMLRKDGFLTYTDISETKETMGKYYEDYIPHHLYVLSDSKIEEGDWKVVNVSIVKDRDEWIVSNKSGFKDKKYKIIACTNKSLKPTATLKNPLRHWVGLPQIPQSFIEYYIDQYNAGNIISKVMVEYETTKGILQTGTVDDYPWRLKLDEDNTIIIRKSKDSWSKDDSDLIKAFENFACAVYDKNHRRDMSFRKRAETMSKNWIEENLN